MILLETRFQLFLNNFSDQKDIQNDLIDGLCFLW